MKLFCRFYLTITMYLVFNSITALPRKYTTEYIFNFMADNFMSSKIKIKIHFKG